jgi:hypothetical protein
MNLSWPPIARQGNAHMIYAESAGPAIKFAAP